MANIHNKYQTKSSFLTKWLQVMISEYKKKQTDGTEYNLNREKKNSENHKDGNNKDSNQISEEKKELSDTSIVEDRENA